jgi:hypothetical protein
MLDSSDQNTRTPSRPERRRSVRICCTGFAEGVSDAPSHLFRGEIRNISETGCFISTKASVISPPGAIVDLSFKFGGTVYRALARVVETLPKAGVRMQFIAIDPAFTERIHQILGANANPATADQKTDR